MNMNSKSMAKDSSDYYEKVLLQPDQFSIVAREKLPVDSFAVAIDSVTAGLDFTDYLQVNYTKRLADVEYSKMFRDNRKAMLSEITLTNAKPIKVLSNGTYFPPTQVLSLGYWAWSEKMATMLPYNY
jgi:hypothetical protein